MGKWSQLVADYQTNYRESTKKYDVLKNLDVFVLDNSIRESTVGALRGHTVENKRAIFSEAKKCGFNNHIVASFSDMTRVDDVFVQELINNGENPETLWAFSEVTAKITNKIPNTTDVPLALQKIKNYKMQNVVFEIDLGDMIYDFSKFTVADMCALIRKWIEWAHENLKGKKKIIVNIRDLPDFMPKNPERLFEVVDYLSKLPESIRLFAINFEEPRGLSVPEECGTWTRYMRKIMQDNNWNGHILVHVHDRYGYADATQLEVLMNGGTGIWASVCIEGAFVGHASITVTLLNMIRMGNKKVLNKYKCKYLRQAAINVTKQTTGLPPFGKQVVYGARALDFVFDLRKDEFDLAEFFNERAPMRMSSLASVEMIVDRLKYVFGENEQFNLEIARQMKEKMLDDMKNNRKEEYMSKYGLAILFDRAGGSLTEKMRDIIVQTDVKSANAKRLICEVRCTWDMWNQSTCSVGDTTWVDTNWRSSEEMLFDTFYHSFMQPYFSCYRCADTLKAMKAIDMDSDGFVDWSEFQVYLQWAMHEYPNTGDVNELLDNVFLKAIIPAMADEAISGTGTPYVTVCPSEVPIPDQGPVSRKNLSPYSTQLSLQA